MARVEKNFLDLPGLQQYDSLLKASIPEADEVTITLDEETNELSLKNVPTVSGEVLIIS